LDRLELKNVQPKKKMIISGVKSIHARLEEGMR
jgi:hypothetical protein